MIRAAPLLLLAFALFGCAGLAPLTIAGAVVGIGSGAVGIAAGGQQIVRDNVKASCDQWAVTKVGWYMIAGLPGGARLDAATFHRLEADNDSVCLNAWLWTSKATDRRVQANTEAVNRMIAGKP